nr:SDR family oxidoreductase [Aeromicrobium senzhongii]
MGLLEGKVAIVTGAAAGIGLATVELFVRHGARVVMGDIDDENGKAAADRIGGAVRFVHADVCAEQDMRNLVSTAVDEFGRLDVMFNNAAAVGARDRIANISVNDFSRVHELVTVSVLLGHQVAMEQFRSQGSGGTIVSTASIASLQGGWGAPAYTVAKHAVVGLVRQAAAEFGAEDVRCNAIAPGPVLTKIQSRSYGVPLERAEEFNGYLDREVGVGQPLGRLGRADDVAGVALFLASDLSAFVNGVVIPVDGGLTAVGQGAYVSSVEAATKRFLGGI